MLGEDDVVRLASDTDFVLLVGISAGDGGRQTRMAKRMQCGRDYLNRYGADVELPFGGIKKSGQAVLQHYGT